MVESVPDGVSQTGESILLTFDQPISLLAEVRTGLHLFPEDSSAGAYTILAGEENRTLRVVLGAGRIQLEPLGVFGDSESPEATGLSLELHRIEGLTDERGRRLQGTTVVVDLAPTAPRAALLESAEWEDVDRSQTVNEGDALVLTWDQEVMPSLSVRQHQLKVPDDLLILPVADDRLDDGDSPSSFELGSGFRRDTRIILGTDPHLTVQGEFDTATVRFPGSASGVAVDGTPIRPHSALVDAMEMGVASRRVVDLVDRIGSCEPFLRVPSSFPHSGELTGHTATALPDGRVVVAGGWRSGEGFEADPPRVSDEVWVYDPHASSPGQLWDGPYHLPESRALHTATYFPGKDGEPDTEDDFVLLVGGYNGNGYNGKPLNSLLTIYPNRDFAISHIHPFNYHPSYRFLHTAHRIPGENLLVLVGGHKRLSVLNRIVEVIQLEYEGGDLAVHLHQLGALRFARREHAATLIDNNGEDWLLLVFGGYGGEPWPREGEVEVSDAQSGVLASPEIFRIDPEDFRLRDARVPTVPGHVIRLPEPQLLPDPGIGKRRGVRIVALNEETDPWLIVGGTEQPPSRRAEPGLECRDVFRFDLVADGESFRMVVRRTGTLREARAAPQTAVLEDGRVLIVGGTRGFERTNIAELYDPLAGDSGSVQTLCRDLQVPRGGGDQDAIWGDFTVSRTFDGANESQRWLIIGGAATADADKADAGCELFRATP